MEKRSFSCGYELDPAGRRGRPLRRNVIDMRYGDLIVLQDKGMWAETDPENDGVATVTVDASKETLDLIAADPDVLVL